MKRQWYTPQLVLLLHAQPEEAVLTACKTGPTVTNNLAPSTYFIGCYQTQSNPLGGDGSLCVTCQAVSLS